MTAGHAALPDAADGPDRPDRPARPDRPDRPDFWPECGYRSLRHGPQGWLEPTDGYLRLFLARPELAPVPESCCSERALHAALLAAPSLAVAAERLALLDDADARDNYAEFLKFRDALLAAGSLQACYIGCFRNGPVGIAPTFVDALAQAILRHLLDGSDDAFEARAAEMLFRAQRISVRDGRVLAADRDALDRRRASAGLGAIGKLLADAQVPLRALEAPVLDAGNAALYWPADGRHNMVLDLTHTVRRDVGHGLQFTLAQAHSGVAALARVLQRWVAHLLGVLVTVQPVQRVDDALWHVGLDAEATALLNDLYEGREVDAQRMGRLLGLFLLRFDDAAEMRADVAGQPVVLGMASNPDGLLRLKPQNLLTNLPLRATS